MANTKISALDAAAALVGSEVVPVVQSGETLKVSVQDIADLGAAAAPVGLFSSFAGTPPAIASGTINARSTGYSTAGRGEAWYQYDAAVNGAYVTANPRTSFLAADGRGFKLRHLGVNPYMFGAAGSGDDAVPLQAFLDYVAANDVGIANVQGSFTSSVALLLGRLTAPLTLVYEGRFNLTVTGTGIHAFTFKDCTGITFDSIAVTGPGSTGTYSSKTWANGVHLNACQRSTFRFMQATMFAFSGVAAFTGNNSLNHLGTVKATDCGSGHRSGATLYGLSTTWSTPVRAGTSGSAGQTTTITVGTQPPTYVTDGTFGAVNDSPYMIRITDGDGSTRLHFITATNSGAGTITVHPWIASTAATGTVDYVYGGGIYLRGADSNLLSFDALDAIRCGVGISAGSLYAPTAKRVVTQFCGTGILWGRSPSGGVIGGKIDGAYFEDNKEDIIRMSRASTGVYNSVDSTYGMDLAKSYSLCAPRNTDETLSKAFSGFERSRFSYLGRIHNWEKQPYGGSSTSTTVVVDRPDMVVPISANSHTVTFSPLDVDLHRMTGYDACRVIVIGTGTDNAPTGSVTFPVPSGWTLNGGASSVVFSSFAGPAEFICRFNVLTLDLVVAEVVNGGGVSGSGGTTGSMLEGLETDTSSGSAHTFNLLPDLEPVHDVTLTANCTFAFEDIQATGEAAGLAVSLVAIIRQNATGGWTATWPGGVIWLVGDGTVNSAASSVSVLSFLSVDEGITWYGFTSTTSGAGFTEEQIEDFAGALVQDSTDLDWTYDDATDKTTAAIKTTAPVKHRELRFVIDGAGEAITTGAKKAYLRVPYNCTVVGWTLIADLTGSIVIDVWKDTYANFPPTDADSIAASALPTLSSAQKNTSTTLTGWTVSLTEGDIVEVNVDSATTVTRVFLDLHVTVA